MTDTFTPPPNTTLDEYAFRAFFSTQFHAALDKHKHIPRGHGRLQAVAALFSITRTTAGKWLNGEGLPDMWRLPRIAQLLNVDPNELLGVSANPLVLDQSYLMINVHDQDHPSDGSSLFLQPSTLERVGLPAGCVLMRVNSNDMKDFAGVGDLVAYNPGVKWIDTGADVYVLRAQGRYVIRRAVRSLRGDIVLSSGVGIPEETFRPTDFTSEPESDNAMIYVAGQVVGRLLQRGSVVGF